MIIKELNCPIKLDQKTSRTSLSLLLTIFTHKTSQTSQSDMVGNITGSPWGIVQMNLHTAIIIDPSGKTIVN